MRGLRTKTADLYAASYESEYDVIVLTETWLDDAISSTMLFDDNRFTVYRTDRSTTNSTKTRGGGVLIAVKKKLPPALALLFQT